MQPSLAYLYLTCSLLVWPAIADMIKRIRKEKEIFIHIVFLSIFTIWSAFYIICAVSYSAPPILG